MEEAIQFVFFRRRHRWVSRATVVVMSETASINIIFALSQHWGFHYFIWLLQELIALLRRLHRSRYTFVACDIGDMF